ncbi:uncharacterized protein LOC122063611 [Macadamia integrifolia]|uniref:uncharacterized protein LOC122063611 n=1 Tax=Macadamia integrifolia TaxID=60698 RepID=UPI001C50174E|nr:uncharacterized protein LOC122063611 [Macadamia integrifolia]
MHKKLPTDDVVSAKGIPLASKCCLCDEQAESFNHLFMGCKFFVAVWKMFLDCFGMSWPNIEDLPLLVRWWIRKCKILVLKEPWSMGLVIVADNVWTEKNSRRYGSRFLSPFYVYDKIKRVYQDSKISISDRLPHISDIMCCRRLGLIINPKCPPEPLEIFWCKPPSGWTKLNVDGSSMGNPGRAGIGGVIRNDLGAMIGSFKNFIGIQSNYVAEFQALIVCLLMAKKLRVSSLWIESDSAAVVAVVQARSIPWFVAQQWISLEPFLAFYFLEDFPLF